MLVPSIDQNVQSPRDAALLSGADPIPLVSRIQSRQADFSKILGKARDTRGKEPEDVARDAAEEFVSISMVQPLLAQLRSTNHTAELFAPSSGETQFQSMLDAHIAQQIVRAKQFPLVDSVARKLLSAKHGEQDAPLSQLARSSHEQVYGSTAIIPASKP